MTLCQISLYLYGYPKIWYFFYLVFKTFNKALWQKKGEGSAMKGINRIVIFVVSFLLIGFNVGVAKAEDAGAAGQQVEAAQQTMVQDQSIPGF